MNLADLHTNQRLVVAELIRRGAEVVTVEAGQELIEVRLDGRVDFLLDRFSSRAPYHSVTASADKYLTKRLLAARGVPVPEGAVFRGDAIREALDHADGIGYPVVLKPNWGSHGDEVVPGIPSRDALAAVAWRFVAVMGRSEPFVVERHVPWPEHRVFATEVGGFAVVRRDPASVVGDGVRTVRELAHVENEARASVRAAGPTSLCPLALDEEARDFLVKAGHALGFEHVPGTGVRVPLRFQSNLAKGGIATDVTDVVHPSLREMAKDVLSAFHGLPIVGIDVLCADVRAPVRASTHAVIEANSNPGLAMHHYPAVGRPRDVASMVVDAMFPGSARSTGMPVLAVA